MVVRYQLGPARVEVEARDLAALEWLDEALRPWFAAPSNGNAAYRVRLVQSPSDLAALERLTASPLAKDRLCFALDSRLVVLPTWSRGDEVVLRDAGCECFYRVRGGQVDVVARPGCLPSRVGLMRVVREIACARTRGDTGVIELHGAALAIGGQAVLILGGRGAGKTSLLLHLLRTGSGEFVANDRVFVCDDTGAYTVMGVPTLVRVRPRTLDEFPELGEGLSVDRRVWLASLRELGAIAGELPPVTDASLALGLTPAQLCHQLDVRPAPSGRLSAVLFPEVQPDTAGWAMEFLGADTVAERVRATRHGLLLRPRPRSVFEELVGASNEPERDEEALSVRVGAAVPGYRCVLGRGVRDEPGEALQLLLRHDAPAVAGRPRPRR